MKQQKKRTKKNIWPVIGLLAGICILAFYPVSDLIHTVYQHTQKKRIVREISETDADERSEYLRQANLYNRYLVTHQTPEGMWPYERQLETGGTDEPLAYLTIPKIALTIPVYHGTDTEVLANGAGHLEGTSLPVGGKSTHAVLTAHSGMRGMRAFDDIRELKAGDEFVIDILGRKLAYRVFASETVLPEEVTGKIGIQENEDLCTLITCTPYGINDHRLLVHARRCRYTEKTEAEKPEAGEVIRNRRIWPLEAALALALLLAVPGMIRKKK